MRSAKKCWKQWHKGSFIKRQTELLQAAAPDERGIVETFLNLRNGGDIAFVPYRKLCSLGQRNGSPKISDLQQAALAFLVGAAFAFVAKKSPVLLFLRIKKRKKPLFFGIFRLMAAALRAPRLDRVATA